MGMPRRNGQIEINYVHRVENICLIIVRVVHEACATYPCTQFLRGVAAALKTIFLLVIQVHGGRNGFYINLKDLKANEVVWRRGGECGFSRLRHNRNANSKWL